MCQLGPIALCPTLSDGLPSLASLLPIPQETAQKTFYYNYIASPQTCQEKNQSHQKNFPAFLNGPTPASLQLALSNHNYSFITQNGAAIPLSLNGRNLWLAVSCRSRAGETTLDRPGSSYYNGNRVEEIGRPVRETPENSRTYLLSHLNEFVDSSQTINQRRARWQSDSQL